MKEYKAFVMTEERGKFTLKYGTQEPVLYTPRDGDEYLRLVEAMSTTAEVDIAYDGSQWFLRP